MEEVKLFEKNSVDTKFSNQRNIFANTLTQCSDCPLRNKCQHTKDIRDKYLKLIEEASDANKLRYKEHPGSQEHAKMLLKDLDKKKAAFNTQFIDELVGRDCIFEKEDITENLQVLQTKYDFADPRVFLIVKEHIRQSVLDFRAFKRSSSEDIITYRYGEDGSRSPIINPVHIFKMASGKHMTDLIKTLDSITKEDVLIDEIKTGNSRLFTDFISKI